jgi:plasmid stabilization system protein ParE
MTYQVTIQPEAFQEIESSYRWLCDNWSPELASSWYNDLQDAIASLKLDVQVFEV